MKARIRKYIIYLTVLLVVVAASEISANLIIYYGLNIEKDKYLTYYRDKTDFRLVTWLLKYNPHPYFGYENQNIRNFEAAEFNKANEFVIGILGGSVAVSFGRYIKSRTEYFNDIRIFVPNLGTKDIVIATLAVGGGKQPQQFIYLQLLQLEDFVFY